MPRTVHHAPTAGASVSAAQTATTVAMVRSSWLTVPGAARYQAWLVPQCGQPTEVETSALNA